jgi:hypothetical protein
VLDLWLPQLRGAVPSPSWVPPWLELKEANLWLSAGRTTTGTP